MLPLILSLTLVLGAGGLVYAMRARRELLQLAARADSAWLAVDHALARRHEVVTAAIADVDLAHTGQDAGRLERALTSQARVRESRDLLRLGSYERRIRALVDRLRSGGTVTVSREEIASLELEILALTDAYDSCASIYNIRVQRWPTRLVARLDGLEPLPLIEFVEPFGAPRDVAAPHGDAGRG